jgi:hypothetical protein
MRRHKICEFFDEPVDTPVIDLLLCCASEADLYYQTLPKDWTDPSKWWARPSLVKDRIDNAGQAPTQSAQTEGGRHAQRWLDPHVQAWHTTRWNDPEYVVGAVDREDKSESDQLKEQSRQERGPTTSMMSHWRDDDMTHAFWLLSLFLNDSESSTAAATSRPSDMDASVAGGASGQLKVKVLFQNDIRVMRFPQNIGFVKLKNRLKERLKIENAERVSMRYEDRESGSSLVELDDDQALKTAVVRSHGALRIHVDVGSGSATVTEDDALRIAERMIQKIETFRLRQPEG